MGNGETQPGKTDGGDENPHVTPGPPLADPVVVADLFATFTRVDNRGEYIRLTFLTEYHDMKTPGEPGEQVVTSRVVMPPKTWEEFKRQVFADGI